MAISLAGLGLLLGSRVAAQDLPRPEVAPEPPKTLHFTKPANTTIKPKNGFDPLHAKGQTPASNMPAPAKKSALGLPAPDADLLPRPDGAGSASPRRALAQKPAPGTPYVPPPRPTLVMPVQAPPPIKAMAQPVGQLPASQLPIQQVFFQQPRDRMSAGTTGEEAQETAIQLVPPGPQRLFQLESESALQERMRQEARQRVPAERITFPEEPVVGRGPFVQRMFPPQTMLVEPNYVCYDRLYFEDKNSERYGWDLGFIQPFVSAGEFYWDLITLPYHFWTNPCQRYECSAGYCLPGDPVPYLCYPPQLSLTGAIAEAGTAVALLAIFP